MQQGDIYRTKWGDKCKVLQFDEKETFYLAADEHNELAERNRTLIYTRAPTTFFRETATLLLNAALTEQEKAIHRTDLPLRLNCFKETFWSTEKFEGRDDFKLFLLQNHVDYGKFEALKADRVVIFPQGQQSSNKKPVLLENHVGFFDGLELMFHCFNMQQPYVNPEKRYFSRFRLIPGGRAEKRLSGFGLYRAGIKGNIPSYYLGGHISLLELELDKSLIV